MKKLFFFAIVALGMTAACQKPDAPVDETNEPVAIQFGVKAPVASVTKTKAAVTEWKNTPVHVLASNYTSKTFKWVESGTIAEGDETITFNNTPLFYEGDIAYDFRACYLGDDVTALTGVTSFSVPVKITGDEDIMAATTNRSDDLDNATPPEGKNKPTDAQMYSAFAARRNVHPSLTFQHMLTRVKVTVNYVGTQQGDLEVSLGDLTVNSKTDGTLNLEGTTPVLTMSGNASPLAITLTDNKGDIMIEPGLTELVFAFNLYANALGDSNPEASGFTLKAKDVQNTQGNAELTAFNAGEMYDVTITVYDLEEITVTATITPWAEGGDYTYDPDDENWTPAA